MIQGLKPVVHRSWNRARQTLSLHHFCSVELFPDANGRGCPRQPLPRRPAKHGEVLSDPLPGQLYSDNSQVLRGWGWSSSTATDNFFTFFSPFSLHQLRNMWDLTFHHFSILLLLRYASFLPPVQHSSLLISSLLSLSLLLYLHPVQTLSFLHLRPLTCPPSIPHLSIFSFPWIPLPSYLFPSRPSLFLHCCFFLSICSLNLLFLTPLVLLLPPPLPPSSTHPSLPPSISPFPSHLAVVPLKIKASQTLIDWRLSGLPWWATERERKKRGSKLEKERETEGGGKESEVMERWKEKDAAEEKLSFSGCNWLCSCCV